jgi:acetolactate synthase-1/2/3 large subunit
VCDALAAARAIGKVVIIAGDQVARDDARSGLGALAAALDAAVGVTPDAKDVYPAREPGYCGVAGTMGHPELATAMREAAACLLVGTRFPVTAAIPVGGVPVLSIGAEPPYLPATHARSRNLAVSLSHLAAEFDAPAAAPAAPPRTTRLRPPPSAGPGLRYRETVDVISDLLPPGSVVIADAGNTGAAVVHHLELPDDGRFGVALGMGGMGYSFGAAIGSVFATGRPTYVIAGDGAFFMHGMEIHTAIEHALPITFIVFNNNAHAMCVIREHLFYENRGHRNRFRPTRLAEGMAAMFPTLPAFAAATSDELRSALSRSDQSAAGPRFIAVDCDPDEIPPFVPFLKGAS